MCGGEFLYVFFKKHFTLWRHQMETFSALLDLSEGKPLVTDGFPSERPVTRRFDVSFDLQTDEQTIETPVIWYVITLVMTSL